MVYAMWAFPPLHKALGTKQAVQVGNARGVERWLGQVGGGCGGLVLALLQLQLPCVECLRVLECMRIKSK